MATDLAGSRIFEGDMKNGYAEGFKQGWSAGFAAAKETGGGNAPAPVETFKVRKVRKDKGIPRPTKKPHPFSGTKLVPRLDGKGLWCHVRPDGIVVETGLPYKAA